MSGYFAKEKSEEREEEIDIQIQIYTGRPQVACSRFQLEQAGSPRERERTLKEEGRREKERKVGEKGRKDNCVLESRV